VESPGVAFSKRGGNESLGPPEGGMILAQPGPLITLMVSIKMESIEKSRVVRFMELQT
jgi:hypothetical protein